MRSFCVALTGGIGAGKTTASAVFQKFGAFVINVDAVGHDVLECSSNEYQMIIEVFGESISVSYTHLTLPTILLV